MILIKSKVFLYCLIFFIFGIGIVSFLSNEIIKQDILWFSLLVSCLVVVILFWKYEKLRLIALLGLFLFLGAWRYSISIQANSPDKIWYYNGQNMEVLGYVCNEPDVRSNNQKLEICVESLERLSLQIGGSASYDVSGKILVSTNIYPTYYYGDRLKINCELKAPEKFNSFSYDRYLARYNIYSVCYYPSLLRETERGLSLKEVIYKKIFSFKHLLQNKINSSLNEPEAGLANAIFLGYKKNLPSELRDDFSKVGISHVMAISGMHIGIISIILMSTLIGFGLKRKHAFYLATFILILYIIIIGLPASAMRAGFMGFLVLWALNLGRLNKITNSLFLTAVILLLINPRLLRDDIGFQLSFLAVLGIIYFYPFMSDFFEKVLKKIIKPGKVFSFLKIINDIFILTISAQILTLPIIAYNFFGASIISPLSNLLIIWILPFLLVGIMLALVLSLIISSLSILFFAPVGIMLKYIIIVTEFLVNIPYAYVEVDYFAWWWMVLYYLIIMLIFYKINIQKKLDF